jgi:hypothetical protein
MLDDSSEENILIKASGMLPISVEPNTMILSAFRAFSFRLYETEKNTAPLFSLPSWVPAKYVKPYVPRKFGSYIVITRVKGTVKYKEISLAEFTNEQGLRSAKNQQYPTSFPVNMKTAWLLGLYVAEGCATLPNGSVLFSLGKDEKKLASRTISIINGLGYSGRMKPDIELGLLAVSFSSKLLSRAFTCWCGHLAENKQIPSFIFFHKDRRIVLAFLNGYWAGDGHSDHRYNNRGHLRLMANTVSLILALQIQLLAARLGFFVSVYRRDHDHGKVPQRVIGKYIIHSQLPRYALQYLPHTEGHPHGSHTVLTRRCILVRVKAVQRVNNPNLMVTDLKKDVPYMINNTIICNGYPNLHSSLPPRRVEVSLTEKGFFEAKEKK